MTLEELRAKVREWDREITGTSIAESRYQMLLDRLDYFAERDWRVYLPAEHPGFRKHFMDRLAAWMSNMKSEDDQKTLLQYACFISFFSHEDFVALYRSALNRIIAPWVASQAKLTLAQSNLSNYQAQIKTHIYEKTWFCPVTDSMDINEFYKVNHLKGISHRPGFYTLQMLAELCGTYDPLLAGNVQNYMSNPGIINGQVTQSLDYLVLLEDIVGSGTQCISAVRWALQNLQKPVLLVPLILCPQGVSAFQAEEKKWGGRLTVRPVVELSASDLLGPSRISGWALAPKMEDLAQRCHAMATFNLPSPFGYKDTGCSLVTFANTPDNTLTLVHDTADGDKWEPLFPRVYRES